MEAPCKKSGKGVKHSSSSSCFITNLPNPIIMEILCRLPIKTLIGSKSVCKSWLHLIRDPHFSQLHQARAPTEICFRHFSYNDHTTKLHLLGNFQIDPLDFKFNTLLEFPKFTVRNNNAVEYNVMEDSFVFTNSCNGLICYYARRNNHAVVCNPCTSEFVTFPAPQTHDGLWTCLGYGLGFSRKANKFKLLRMIRRKDTWVDVAEICTIEKACSWKTVAPCASPSSNSLPHVTLFQGTLHWFSLESCGLAIQTFDFEDDQFGRLPLPRYPSSGRTKDNVWQQKLGVLTGCLVLTVYTKEGVNIWLMKEYGVQDSWTKLFCLGFGLHEGLKYKHCLPITYMDNGEILMTCTDYINFTTSVFFYDPILKSVRVIGSGPGSLTLTTYRPSVVMLKDSMLGYKVHVKARCTDLTHTKMSTSPDWWKPRKNSSSK